MIIQEILIWRMICIPYLNIVPLKTIMKTAGPEQPMVSLELSIIVWEDIYL